MRIAAIAIAILSLAVARGPAHADTARVWTAAKTMIPADAKLVIVVDIAAVQKTQLFQTLFSKLHDSPDAATLLDTMKQGCKLDPLAIVRGMVIALSSDQQEGAAYVALSGVDRAKLSSCLARLAKTQHKDAKISVKQTGDFIEVSGEDDTAYFRWIGKDVLVVPVHPEDKAAAVKWMGGRTSFDASELAKTVAKVNTAATIWGAAAIPRDLQPGLLLTASYGAVTTGKGNLAIDFHAVMDSAKQATAAVALAHLITEQTERSAPQLGALLDSLKIVANNDEVLIKGTMAEKDLQAALAEEPIGLGGSQP